MPEALTTDRISLLQTHINAGDRIAYYEQLSEWGYAYAELALGVVNADTVAGRTANAFFLDRASEAGVNISPNQLASISLQLAEADLQARIEFPGSAQGQELPVDTISTYHGAVFSSATQGAVGIEAWTPAFPLSLINDPQEREAFWDALIAANTLNATFILAFPQLQDITDSAVLAQLAGYEIDLIQAGSVGFVTESNSFGPFDIALGNGGRLIGDGISSATLSGTEGNDVILGFIGLDTLNGGFGDDRLYGGGGIDELVGGVGSDLLVGGTQNDILISGTIDGPDRMFVPDADADRLEGGEDFDTYIVGQDINLGTSDGSFETILEETSATIGFSQINRDFNFDSLSRIDTISDADGSGRIIVSSINETSEFPELTSFRDARSVADLSDPENFVQGTYERASSVTNFIDDGNGITSTNSLTSLNGRDVFFTGPVTGAFLGPKAALFYLTADENPAGNVPLLVGLDPVNVDGFIVDYIPIFAIEDFHNGDFGITIADENIPVRDNSDPNLPFISGDADDNSLTGIAGLDFIEGGAGDDFIFGGAGNDIISGNAGADFLFGEDGNGRLIIDVDDGFFSGGDGVDTLVFQGNDDNRIILNDGDDFTQAGDGRDFINGGNGNDSLDGQDGDDSLNGGAGNDVLGGGNGNDRLTAGSGDDLLFGGAGADIFIFDSDEGTNTIFDFEDGVDLIDFRTSEFSNDSDVLAAAVQVGSDLVIQGEDQIIAIQNFSISDFTAADIA